MLVYEIVRILYFIRFAVHRGSIVLTLTFSNLMQRLAYVFFSIKRSKVTTWMGLVVKLFTCPRWSIKSGGFTTSMIMSNSNKCILSIWTFQRSLGESRCLYPDICPIMAMSKVIKQIRVFFPVWKHQNIHVFVVICSVTV